MIDYFSIAILIIIVFTFASEKNIKSYEELQKRIENLDEIVISILAFTRIIKISEEENIEEIFKNKNLEDVEYVMLINNKIKMSEENKKILVANFVNSKYTPCAFNSKYTCSINGKKGNKKKLNNFIDNLYIMGINYLNIFDKKSIKSYGVIIFKKEDVRKIVKSSKGINSYVPNELTDIDINNSSKSSKDRKKNIKKIYLSKIYNASIWIIIKLLLLIIMSGTVTANLIFSLISIQYGFANFLIALLIYYCYSYVARYIYKPIGKYKIIATYLFPFYLIIYIILTVINMFQDIIKEKEIS